MWDVLFKLADMILGGLSEKRRKRKRLLEQFEKLKRRVLYVTIVNDFPVELHKLRTFLIEKGLVEQPAAVREFFAKWLTNPIVVVGKSAANVFSKAEIEQLLEALNALKL